MSGRELRRRFERLFSAYLERPGEEHLARIADLGEELVQSRVPPEEVAEIFEEALLKISEQAPHITLKESADRISTPLVEMLMAYGLAFREQLARQRVDEETRLAAKAMESASEGMWVADPQGKFIVVNPALSRLTGYPAEEIIKGGLPLLCWEGNRAIALGEA